MTALSLIALLIFGFLSLFFYKQRYTVLKLVPFGLAVGLVFLLLSRYSPFVEDILTAGWGTIPGLLINVVFAALFIGKRVIGPRKIWRFAGPQVVFGQSLAWGQYVVGIALTALVLVPVFQMSPLSAALIEISFEGGHGTAAGLGHLFEELDFGEGADLALGLATVGIATGLATGLFMTAVWTRKSQTGARRSNTPARRRAIHKALGDYILETHNRFFAGHVFMRTLLQLGLIGLAIGLGSGLRLVLMQVESLLMLVVDFPEVVAYIPLFPLAMIGGIMVQYGLEKLSLTRVVHAGTVSFAGNLALELVIITAIATMSLTAISDNWAPFVLLAAVGTVWNVVVFLVLAPRLMRPYWFERGIGDYGQSMGMTATGLLLMKNTDPANKSEALERFGYKQLLFEPIVGGGLFTAMSMILISEFGLGAMFAVTLAVLLFWLVLGWKSFGGRIPPPT